MNYILRYIKTYIMLYVLGLVIGVPAMIIYDRMSEALDGNEFVFKDLTEICDEGNEYTVNPVRTVVSTDQKLLITADRNNVHVINLITGKIAKWKESLLFPNKDTNYYHGDKEESVYNSGTAYNGKEPDIDEVGFTDDGRRIYVKAHVSDALGRDNRKYPCNYVTDYECHYRAEWKLSDLEMQDVNTNIYYPPVKQRYQEIGLESGHLIIKNKESNNTFSISSKIKKDSHWEFTADHRYLAVGREESGEDILDVWSLDSKSIVYTTKPYEHKISCLMFTKSNQRLITVDFDEVKVWNLSQFLVGATPSNSHNKVSSQSTPKNNGNRIYRSDSVKKKMLEQASDKNNYMEQLLTAPLNEEERLLFKKIKNLKPEKDSVWALMPLDESVVIAYINHHKYDGHQCEVVLRPVDKSKTRMRVAISSSEGETEEIFEEYRGPYKGMSFTITSLSKNKEVRIEDTIKRPDGQMSKGVAPVWPIYKSLIILLSTSNAVQVEHDENDNSVAPLNYKTSNFFKAYRVASKLCGKI